MIHSLRVAAEMDNAAGGWEIGGKKYQVELIEYDTKNSQTSATSAINKLVFEDKVNFILFDNNLADACLPITEANKVIVLEGSPTPVCLLPDKQYSFQTALVNCQYAALAGYLAKTFPDKKTMICATTDDQVGHATSEAIVNSCKVFGITTTMEFFPTTATDLSAVGTKVKNANPDFFDSEGGALPYKAVYDSGYRGQLVALNPLPYSSAVALSGKDALEGEVSAAWPVEFDPALTTTAQEFKAAYITKYGAWDSPEVQCTADYYCLKAALIKAGTLDTTAVANVIASGLEFDSLNGTCEMVARPDLGNTRTVDSVVAYPIKKVVDGKITQFATMTLEEVKSYFVQVYK